MRLPGTVSLCMFVALSACRSSYCQLPLIAAHSKAVQVWMGGQTCRGEVVQIAQAEVDGVVVMSPDHDGSPYISLVTGEPAAEDIVARDIHGRTAIVRANVVQPVKLALRAPDYAFDAADIATTT